MSGQDDYPEDMSGVEEVGAGAGRPPTPSTDTAAIAHFLGELRSLGEAPAPAPTPKLDAIFAGAVPLRRRRRSGPVARRAVLIAVAVIAGVVTAAANHTLPAPAQRVVSNVVNSVTPFHIGGPPSSRPLPRVPGAGNGSEDDKVGTQRRDDSRRTGSTEQPDSAPGLGAGSSPESEGAAAEGGDGQSTSGGAADSGGRDSAGRSGGGEHDAGRSLTGQDG